MEKATLNTKNTKTVNAATKIAKTVITFKTPNTYAKALVLQEKHTDAEIVNLVKTMFADRAFTVNYVSTTRNDLNKGYYKSIKLEKSIVRILGRDEIVCKICGRLLKDSASKKTQIGPECAKKAALAVVAKKQ